MGRVGRRRTALRCSNNRHGRMKNMDSEDSDDDYVAEVDEIDEQSDELGSLVGDASEEEVSCFEEDDDDEQEEEGEEEELEEEEEEEEQEEEEDDDEEWRTVVKPKGRKRSARSRNNGIKKAKKRRKVICSDDADSDDDDEEFTPAEIESLEEEEEEFSLPKRKPKKRRTTVKKKSSVRSRRRKTSTKAARKSLRKKSKKTGSLRRKAKSGDDEDFIENGPTLRAKGRGRGKKKHVHKKRRVTAGSDSDFCSDSSDYEFTISEEEREQIREANNFCRGVTTNLRSSRRIQEDEALCDVRKPSVRKGKEKAEEPKNDAGKPVCGICLTEETKNTIRGTLNCCNHYFCFACIMEWSKVESRCPLCKQRFVTISKPARCVKGFDLRNSVIQIPERDQVYQPSEEELRDFLNPYENVICTECHQGGDDDLMLLCDVCDSPAHTYCVGLGRVVPDGNWYCDGCRPVALGSSHIQAQDLTPDRRTNGHSSYGASTYENMAEIDLNVTIPETPVSQGNGFLSSPRYAGGSFRASPPVSGMGVSTVFGRRRIQRQIRDLLSSRLSPMSTGARLDSLRSILGAASTFQQSRTTDVGSSHHGEHVDISQENPLYNVQNRDLYSERLNHIVGPVDQASSSANNHLQWNGLNRMNFGASRIQTSSNEQIHRCTSQPSVGFDSGTSLSNNQDEDYNSLVKQRVHSIVNSQLKNLSRELNLGHDDYAIILRGAIDAIMVAFEREPPRLDIPQQQGPCCGHVNGLSNVEISPMRECCLACFENFAKDTLKRVMNMRYGATYWWRLRY